MPPSAWPAAACRAGVPSRFHARSRRAHASLCAAGGGLRPRRRHGVGAGQRQAAGQLQGAPGARVEPGLQPRARVAASHRCARARPLASLCPLRRRARRAVCPRPCRLRSGAVAVESTLLPGEEEEETSRCVRRGGGRVRRGRRRRRPRVEHAQRRGGAKAGGRRRRATARHASWRRQALEPGEAARSVDDDAAQAPGQAGSRAVELVVVRQA